MCNCGKNRGLPPPIPRSSSQRPAQPARTVSRELTPVRTVVMQSKEGQVCRKCGWAYKKIKHLDLKNSEVIEKWACPNRMCVLYNQ